MLRFLTEKEDGTGPGVKSREMQMLQKTRPAFKIQLQKTRPA